MDVMQFDKIWNRVVVEENKFVKSFPELLEPYEITMYQSGGIICKYEDEEFTRVIFANDYRYELTYNGCLTIKQRKPGYKSMLSMCGFEEAEALLDVD